MQHNIDYNNFESASLAGNVSKNIVLLGSTGSIGVQALDVARLHNMRVKALSANSNIALLEQQAREFLPDFVCIADPALYVPLKTNLADTNICVSAGKDELCRIASLRCDMVINAIVGMAGLEPTLAALKAHNPLGLANKESLVVGGTLVTETARENNTPIIPIDSEHSAIFQSLLGSDNNPINKIILTASGGPFFGYTKNMLNRVTREQALKHPNWSMGQKITVDSATMMNKGFELIEAIWLFNLSPSQVEIVVHRQSILHSAVEFIDGSVIAQLGSPDMRVPIQFALTYPKRFPSPAKPLSLTDIGKLTFEKPDRDAFPCLDIAQNAIENGGNAPCIVNCANEEAVQQFLDGNIKFAQIPQLIHDAVANVRFSSNPGLDVLLDTQDAARQFVREQVARST